MLGGAVCTLAIWTTLIFSGVSAAVRSHYLGLYATAVCIILFASPLSTIATVVKTRAGGEVCEVALRLWVRRIPPPTPECMRDVRGASSLLGTLSARARATAPGPMTGARGPGRAYLRRPLHGVQCPERLCVAAQA